jgi:hypothetical protein
MKKKKKKKKLYILRILTCITGNIDRIRNEDIGNICDIGQNMSMKRSHKRDG